MWGWSLSPGTVPFRAGSSSRARDEPRLYLVPSRGGGGEEPLPNPPSRPCKAVKNSWKALGGGEVGAGPWGKAGDGWGLSLGCREGRGTGTARARSSPSAGTRWELALPLGLLCSQRGFSLLGLPHGTAAIPLLSPGSGLGSAFASPCSAVPFASSTGMLQGSAPLENRRRGRGGFTAPDKKGLVLALQQLPLFLTWQRLRAPGGTRLCLFGSVCLQRCCGATGDRPLRGVSLRSERRDEVSCPEKHRVASPSRAACFQCLLHRASAAAGAPACSELARERPPVPPGPELELGSSVPCRSSIIGAGGEVGRPWGPWIRTLQLPRAEQGGAGTVPLIASNTAGCSVGSLGVAGLISRIHLGGKSGQIGQRGERKGTLRRSIQDAALKKGKETRRGC